MSWKVRSTFCAVWTAGSEARPHCHVTTAAQLEVAINAAKQILQKENWMFIGF